MSAASASVAKPRILFISTARTIGGGEIYLANLLPALQARYQVTVLGRPPLIELVKHTAAVHRLSLFPEWIEKILRRTYRIKKIYYRLYFKKYLKTHGFDIVNLQEFDGAFVEAIDFSPLALTEQTRLFVPENLKGWARGLFGKIDAVYCVSRLTMRDVTDLGVPSSKCILIHNGVDTEKFKPATKKGIYITWIGRFEEIDKNPLLFASIARAAQTQGLNYRFRMVGDGKAMSKVKDFVKSNGLNNLELSGKKQPAEMIDIYHQASVLCMTSKTEGLPFAALEAMACGIPVVAADVGGLSEIIDSPRVGSLIESFSQSDFLEALRAILDNPKLYERMSRAARLRIEKGFSANRQVEQTVEQYELLLKARRG